MEAPTQPISASPPAETVGAFLRRSAPWLLLAAAAAAVLFAPAVRRLALIWYLDADLAYGFLIPPACALFLYLDRDRLGAAPARRSLAGLLVLLVALAVYIAGRARLNDFPQRAGVYGAIVGSAWFLLGGAALRRSPFPFFFLAFAVPPPSFLLEPVRLALREIATRMSADVLGGIGIAAVRSGNTLHVGTHQLEVVDACSGIRSLLVIVAAAVLFAHLFRCGILRGSLLVLTAIPLTVAVNILRITIVAVVLETLGLDLSVGWTHDVLSLTVFGVSLLVLFGGVRFYGWLLPARAGEARP